MASLVSVGSYFTALPWEEYLYRMLQYHLRNPPWRHHIPFFPPNLHYASWTNISKNKEMMYRSLLLESVLPYETRLTIRPSSTLEPHIPSTAYRSPTSVLRYFSLGRVTSAKSSTFFTLRGSILRSTQEEENKPGGTPSHRQLFHQPRW